MSRLRLRPLVWCAFCAALLLEFGCSADGQQYSLDDEVLVDAPLLDEAPSAAEGRTERGEAVDAAEQAETVRPLTLQLGCATSLNSRRPVIPESLDSAEELAQPAEISPLWRPAVLWSVAAAQSKAPALLFDHQLIANQ